MGQSPAEGVKPEGGWFRYKSCCMWIGGGWVHEPGAGEVCRACLEGVCLQTETRGMEEEEGRHGTLAEVGPQSI